MVWGQLMRLVESITQTRFCCTLGFCLIRRCDYEWRASGSREEVMKNWCWRRPPSKCGSCEGTRERSYLSQRERLLILCSCVLRLRIARFVQLVVAKSHCEQKTWFYDKFSCWKHPFCLLSLYGDLDVSSMKYTNHMVIRRTRRWGRLWRTPSTNWPTGNGTDC